MSKFLDLIGVADSIVLDQFANRLRWTKADESTADIEGIIDLEVELLGPHGDVAYQGKTITGKSSVLGSYKQGETLQALDSSGTVTGKVYTLQQTLADDGGLITIEVRT